MGLDMYLYRKTYVQNWDHMGPKERHTITITGPKAKSIKPERITEIVEQVGYWRKANAIHAWFVKNVQGGEDDCRPYPVSLRQLQELLEVCRRVLAGSKLAKGKVENGYKILKGAGDGRIVKKPILEEGEFIEDPALAIELLPAQSGFFFGGTDYDQWYIRDLRDTVEILEEFLRENGVENGELYYEASW